MSAIVQIKGTFVTVPDKTEFDTLASKVADVAAQGAATAAELGRAEERITKLETPPPVVLPPPPPPVVTAPLTITDLAVVAATDTMLTVRFTEVSDGTGHPAQYELRYQAGSINWGSASVLAVQGTTVGALRSIDLSGLTPGTSYQCQIVAYRGTLNVDAVFGSLSTVVTGLTSGIITPPPPPSGVAWPHEPVGLTVYHETGWENGLLAPWTVYNEEPSKLIRVIPVTDSPIGEKNVFNIAYAAGHVGGGGAEGRLELGAAKPKELFVGYYVQVNPTWQGHSSGINKMVFLADGAQDGVFSAIWYEMYGVGQGNLGLYVVNQSAGGSGYVDARNLTLFSRGIWHQVEIHQVQGQPGRVRVWVDGVLVLDVPAYTRAAPFDAVAISGIWGGVGDSKQHADFMRFDRIRVSGRS